MSKLSEKPLLVPVVFQKKKKVLVKVHSEAAFKQLRLARYPADPGLDFPALPWSLWTHQMTAGLHLPLPTVTRLALLTSFGYCQTRLSSVRALSCLLLPPAKLLAPLPLPGNLPLQVFYTFTPQI